MPSKNIIQISKNKYLFLFFVFALLATSVVLGWRGWMIGDSYTKCLNKFSFINPIFACFDKVTVDKKGYVELRDKLTLYIDEEKKADRASVISLFFRDLEGGPTLGINDRENFVPASLLKLPIVITFLRLSEERDDVLLSQELMYNDQTVLDNGQVFPPEEIIKANTPYTAEELIERIMKYSDNFALELLHQHIESLGQGRDLVVDTYKDLGIIETSALNVSSVSTKGYSSIFRLLYNSSFLNKKNSEKLLGFLSESTFNQGLRAGLPVDTKLAHKFGEREISATGEKQLHDCGIVYYPENPYLLCVMTKGKNMTDLTNIIKYISNEVYKEFNSRKFIDLNNH